MKKTFDRIRVFFSSLKNADNIQTKFSRFGLGFIIFQILNKAGVVLINPVIIYFFEIKLAILFMIVVSILLRYSLILIYDNQKIDWFLIEEFKFLLSKGESFLRKDLNTTIKIMAIFYNFGRFILIIVLVVYDPFLTVVYYRPGFNLWNKIPDIKTFGLFIISIIACAFISLSWTYPAIELIK